MFKQKEKNTKQKQKQSKQSETERNKYEILIHSIDAQSYNQSINQSHIHASIHSINPVYKQINKQTATTTKEINEYNLLQIFICECNDNNNYNNNKSI